MDGSSTASQPSPIRRMIRRALSSDPVHAHRRPTITLWPSSGWTGRTLMRRQAEVEEGQQQDGRPEVGRERQEALREEPDRERERGPRAGDRDAGLVAPRRVPPLELRRSSEPDERDDTRADALGLPSRGDVSELVNDQRRCPADPTDQRRRRDRDAKPGSEEGEERREEDDRRQTSRAEPQRNAVAVGLLCGGRSGTSRSVAQRAQSANQGTPAHPCCGAPNKGEAAPVEPPRGRRAASAAVSDAAISLSSPGSGNHETRAPILYRANRCASPGRVRSRTAR